MSLLALLRHGPTAWNREGRMTGRADIPLTPEGRAQVTGYSLPDDLRDAVAHHGPSRGKQARYN